MTSLAKLGQVTDIELEEAEGGLVNEQQLEKGVSIGFDNVSFTFPSTSNAVLQNVNLEILNGEKVQVISDNDQSARAMLYLSAALLESTEGVMEFNGLISANQDLSILRSRTGDSLRKDMLFHGTVMENISMNRPQVSHAEVLELAERISLTSELKYFPKGFDTMINPDSMSYGKNLIQKIILARAIVGKPRLLVLKDQFLKLDKTCKEAILDLVFKEMDQTTVLVASSHQELLQYVDKVVKIEKTKVTQVGTPDGFINHFKK
jgi:ABC-type multidrug transport system fused ATPase/permease subunit